MTLGLREREVNEFEKNSFSGMVEISRHSEELEVASIQVVQIFAVKESRGGSGCLCVCVGIYSSMFVC